MIEGEVLIEQADYRYSPWFQRQGDQVIITTQVVACSLFVRLTVDLQTKNRADTDASATSFATTTILNVGLYSGTATGAMEMLRYRYLVGSTAGPQNNWVHFQMLEPIWLHN